MQLGQFVYMLAFCLVMCFLSYLSGYIISGSRALLTDDESAPAIRNIRNAVGGFFLLWAFLFAIDIPLFISFPLDGSKGFFYYRVAYFADMFFWLPAVCYLSQALLQYKYNRWIWVPLTTMPVLTCFVWFLYDGSPVILEYAAVVVMISFFVFAWCYSFSYRRYMQELKSEYSDLSHRDVRWTIYAYVGLVAQLALYFWDYYYYSLFTSLLYDVTTVFNAMFITHCAKRMLPVVHTDDAVECETVGENPVEGASQQDEKEDSKTTAIDMEMIQHRLMTYCESAELYLDPQLTRDMLCRSIGVNKNYLALYFREKDISYYLYINTLRVKHACKLLDQAEVNVSIKDVAKKTGYTSYRSFYNSFCEIIGCKPSEYLRRSLLSRMAAHLQNEE